MNINRLFFGGHRPLIFHSIRSMRLNQNYEEYIKALTMFHHVIESKKYTKKIKKRHYKIIDRLIKHYDDKSQFHGEYKNKFPKYVNQLFKSFVESKKSIKLNLEHINTFFTGLTPLFISRNSCNLPLFDYLSVIFRNATEISVWGTNKVDNIYMKELLMLMESLNKLGLEQLKYIKIYDVKYENKILNESFVSKYERELQFNLKAYCNIKIDIKTRMDFRKINNGGMDGHCNGDMKMNEIGEYSNLMIDRKYDSRVVAFQDMGRHKSECVNLQMTTDNKVLMDWIHSREEVDLNGKRGGNCMDDNDNNNYLIVPVKSKVNTNASFGIQ